MSSLETTAAPWRANARSVSDFPAPIPPVIATETGRERLPVVFVRRRGSFPFGVARAGHFGDDLVGGLVLDRRRLPAGVVADVGRDLGGLVLGEDLLRKSELGGALAERG